MKLKPRLTVVILALCATAALAATASAGGGAETTVTIKGNGDWFGFVKSPKANLCANGRKVTLFKQKGGQQDPRNDTKVGSDTAQANGDGYMWSTGNTGGHGNFYARVGKIQGCQGDTSKTVHS